MILRTQQRLKSERHNVFTKEINDDDDDNDNDELFLWYGWLTKGV